MNNQINANQEMSLKNAIVWPLAFLAIIWLMFLIQNATGFRAGILGVLPREAKGLIGIFSSPLVHGSFDHLVSNSIPFLVLCSSIFYFYKKVALKSFIMIYALSGVSLWLLGNLFFCGTEFNRSCFLPHIGASGVVYGLLAFIFWNGLFRKSLQAIVLALVVTVMYSGYFAGIVPNAEKPNISWDGHLLGAISGIFTAYFYKDELEEHEVESMKDIYANQSSERTRPYLPKDIFDMTKEERIQRERFLREQMDPDDIN